MELRNYIFIDEELVESFAEQIGIEFSEKEVLERTQKAGSLGGGIAKALISKENFESVKISSSGQSKLRAFESELESRNGLKVLGSPQSLEPKIGENVRLRGTMFTPELFDNLEAFRQFLPLMTDGYMKSMLMKSVEKPEGVNLDAFIGLLTSSSSVFPLAVEGPGCTAVVEVPMGKLQKRNELSELFEDDVTVLGHATKTCAKDDSIEFCNTFKLLGIGRSARRSMGKNSQGIEIVPGPAVKLKPLVIWQ